MDAEELEVEEALRRQDEALALLERLRIAEPLSAGVEGHPGGGRRDFRRWPTPDGVTVEIHDGDGWLIAAASDLGIGGVRVTTLPDGFQGPVPVRLKSAGNAAVLALADLMWRDSQTGAAGLRFEFLDPEERDGWTVLLIDALLARYALA